jgi:hypothetical protein
MFNQDIIRLSNEIKTGKISDNNLEEVIRREIAHVVMSALMDSHYREEVEEYVASVES